MEKAKGGGSGRHGPSDDRKRSEQRRIRASRAEGEKAWERETNGRENAGTKLENREKGDPRSFVRSIDRGITFGIEKPRNAILALRDVEDPIEPLSWLTGTCASPIDQVWPVSMYQGTERQTVPPGTGEVRDAYTGITRRRSSCPSQQSLAGCNVRFLADDYIGYL